MLTKIEILEIKLLSENGSKPLKAFVSVKVGDWALHDWRINSPVKGRGFLSPRLHGETRVGRYDIERYYPSQGS